MLNSWGKGKYDPRYNIDGLSKPVVIPPAYGLAGIHRVTFTGDGDDIAYWNRYVAVTQMGGHGTFTEPRLNLNITNGNAGSGDAASCPALQAYQLSLAAPPPPAGSFDAAAAARGKLVFEGAGGSARAATAARCSPTPTASCIRRPTRWPNRRSPSYASRSATKQYRTTPLRGVWQHAPYFHDGSAATLEAVVATYNTQPVARPERAAGRPTWCST